MTVEPAHPGVRKIKAYMTEAEDDGLPAPDLLLNSNESVFGPSPQAIAAARDAAAKMERYSENVDAILAPEIAAFFGLDASKITVGNGSDDLLARLARIYLGPGTEMLRSENGYPKAPNYAFANDAEVHSAPDQGFRPSVPHLIDGITDRTRMIYLANPENPAGTYLGSDELQALHAAMPANALLVLDSAYDEYIDDPGRTPINALVDGARNIVMTRTFSKIFGLAGARVGWLYGPDEIVADVRRVATTFPLSGVSLAAARAALTDHDHFNMVYQANRDGRAWLSEQLSALGLEIVPSQTNFVLAGFADPDKSAEAADRHLRAAGIAIRRFPSPAFRNYLRITLGRRAELARVVDVLKAFLGAVSN